MTDEDAYPGISSPYVLGQIWQQRCGWHGAPPRRGMIVAYLGIRPVVQYLRDNGMFDEARTVMWQPKNWVGCRQGNS
jgi:hypothetical protein